MNIAIYCGSSLGNTPIYENSCKSFVSELKKYNYGIVYGGSESGLMGVISNEAIKYNIETIGVITDDLALKEIENKNISTIYKVSSLSERKNKMEELSSAFIALPGGFGTLDEIFEVLTLSQIGEHTKPCIFYNINGFFDKLIEFLKFSQIEGFIDKRFIDMIIVSDDLEEIIKKIEEYHSPKNKWIK